MLHDSVFAMPLEEWHPVPAYTIFTLYSAKTSLSD